MKNFTLIIFLICSNAFANWVNWPSLTTVYSTVGNCQSFNPAGDCLQLPDGSIASVLEKVAEYGNDYANPNWEAASQVTPCSGEVNCYEVAGTVSCDGLKQKFIDELFTQVYCTQILSYPQIPTGSYVLQENATAKTAYLAAKAVSDAQEAGMKEVTRLRAAGQRVISLVILRNGQKNLTDEQVIQLHTTYSVIKAFLEDGSLDRARAAVVAATPDGVIMTQADKDAIIAEIDSLL